MVSPARRSAFRALYEKHYRPACPSDRDRRLAENIVFGVLQNERFLDACLGRFMKSSVRSLNPKVLVLLRMSAYQILFLDRIPVSAAVNDAVALCKEEKAAFAAGFVNAVLRKVASRREDLLSEAMEPAVRYSHPDWIAERLRRAFGETQTELFLAENQKPPLLCLQVNTVRSSLDELCALLQNDGIPVRSVNPRFPSLEIDSTDVSALPGYREGFFYVQDDAARAAALLADPKPGCRILDACAAPGGKSIAAAISGAEVLACDLKAARMKRCEENFARLGLTIGTRVSDAGTDRPEWHGCFDAVIADVPCTGSGIIRKHPEIRHKTEDELSELLEIQARILSVLSEYVKPGGLLVYSTCSVLAEEDEQQTELFLRKHPEYSAEPFEMDGFDCRGGMMRSWPHIHHRDGFFAARLRKDARHGAALSYAERLKP